MKKVYLVVEDWSNEFDCEININVFENYDKAYEYFNDMRISNDNFIESDDKVVNSESDYFEIYEDGSLDNYYIVRLEEKEVK